MTGDELIYATPAEQARIDAVMASAPPPPVGDMAQAALIIICIGGLIMTKIEGWWG